jgi:hypothetical protein
VLVRLLHTQCPQCSAACLMVTSADSLLHHRFLSQHTTRKSEFEALVDDLHARPEAEESGIEYHGAGWTLSV